MRTEDLIQQLAADAPPVRRLPPLSQRLAGWAVLAVASLLLVMMLMGVRREIVGTMDGADFAVQAALLVLTALSAALGALVVSVPGAERSPLVRWLPLGAAAACVGWGVGALLFAAMTGAPTGRVAAAWHCVFKVTSVAALPSIVLFVMVRRAAPLRAGWAGLLILLATGAVGVLGANIICPNDRPVHLLLWHLTPLVALAALGAALGVALLRFPSQRT